MLGYGHADRPADRPATVEQAMTPREASEGTGMRRNDAEPGSFDPGREGGRVKRRLAAVLAADIKGYGTLMDGNEEDTHRRVGAEMDKLVEEIETSYGSVFSFAGDGLMAEFPSAVEALKCALRVQAAAARRAEALPPEQRIQYRIGINAGEVLIQKGHTGGKAVNVAARLEQIAEPGSIYLTEAVYEQAGHIVTVNYDRIGEPPLKNLREPIVVFAISAQTCRRWAGIPTLPKPAAAATGVGPGALASIAVLPFRAARQEDEDGYFAQGVVDDIIRILGGLKDLIVISRSATLGFARSPLDLRRVRHELDVRYVLHGSVGRSRGRVRLTAELNEAETGRVLWADRFDEDMTNLFDVQDSIATRVAAAVAPQVLEQELARIDRKHPESLTAYDLTLQALHLLHRPGREAFFEARDLLRQALAHDPSYGPALSHTAYWHLIRIAQGWSRDADADATAAIQAAHAAIERDRNDALALALHGHILSYVRKDFTAATVFLDRARAAGPSCAWAWSLSSLTRGYVGDGPTAVTHARHAVRLSPLGPEAALHEHALSQAHYIDGDYEQAADWGRLSAAHNSAHASNLRTLIASLVVLGRLDEARGYAQRLMHLSPGFRIAEFRSRTPLQGALRDQFAQRLRLGGLPE